MTKREFLILTTGLGVTLLISESAKSKNLTPTNQAFEKCIKMKTTINPEFLEIIKDAVRAPSGHNTQPWKFEVSETTITIKPDFSRSLHVVDADNHALFISLGCALENLILSAKAHKQKPTIATHFAAGRDEINIELIPSNEVPKDDLFDFIQTRQCTRTAYDTKPIDESVLQHLMDAAIPEAVEIVFITNKDKIKELEPFIVEGSNAQFNNPYFVNELVSWIRFSSRSAATTRDGIWSASMGMPGTGSLIGNAIMKHIVSAKSEAKRWKNLIDKSAAFALFVVKENTKDNWVRLGQSFQRFGLRATQLKLKHAHVNMPCEEKTVRQKLIKHFNLTNGRQPLLLVRLGYAEAMPYSYRRLVNEVVLTQSA
jgi:hypothetical protein